MPGHVYNSKLNVPISCCPPTEDLKVKLGMGFARSCRLLKELHKEACILYNLYTSCGILLR